MQPLYDVFTPARKAVDSIIRVHGGTKEHTYTWNF